ncbi:phosphatidylethanolamine-binding protein [Xylariaceae sp. FL0255]|nr:phosphatidylethanolamine-binding protein [Xylariaceae sp. FL0255]
MSGCQRVASVRPILQTIQQHGLLTPTTAASFARSFSNTSIRRDEVPTTTDGATSIPPSPPTAASSSISSMAQMEAVSQQSSRQKFLDRTTATTLWAERTLVKAGTPPIGSRRRRAAIRTSQNIPFEQLPYQCFQEARKLLQEDRAEKIQQIAREQAKIKYLENTPVEKVNGGQRKKDKRLQSMKKYLEELKILADINDPLVKRKFEDGLGDMTKPIYRYLAEKKWRGMPFRMITQRIEQLHITPDVYPKFEPVVDVQMFFRRKKVEPGEILNSLVSEVPPRLKVQVFNAGERLMTVVVVDLDVPNAETDSFDRRCHYLAANVPISPDQPSLPLGKVNKETQLAVPWLPAFSQMGAPYHRLALFVMEQTDGPIDIAKLRELYSARDGFSLRSFRDKFPVNPVGFNIFRTVWDEGTKDVMERAGVPGADIQFKHKRVYSLKPPKKARGWEAKRSKPKYKSLWKYSRRIHGLHKRR